MKLLIQGLEPCTCLPKLSLYRTGEKSDRRSRGEARCVRGDSRWTGGDGPDEERLLGLFFSKGLKQGVASLRGIASGALQGGE